MWCPAGAAPGGSGCTSGYATLTDLFSHMPSTPAAGTIYFTSAYNTNDATIDGSTTALSAWNTYALTLQGGWNSTTNAVSGVSLFTVPLATTNWNGDVTLNDITISGATDVGLSVDTTGKITVHDVQSNNNKHGNGAELNNLASENHSPISVDDSTFGYISISGSTPVNYGNGGFGLVAKSPRHNHSHRCHGRWQ